MQLFTFVSLLLLTSVVPQSHGTPANFNSSDSTIRNVYDSALIELAYLLTSRGSFKDAVFTTENAFFNNDLDRKRYYSFIDGLRVVTLNWSKANPVKDYRFADSINFQKNYSIYAVLKDTVRIIDSNKQVYKHIPFSYDFKDFFGNNVWANMFVTKLLATHKGNCHSLPYLYKILADEVGASCWLSLAPNHIYIKNRSKKIGWYNTELTSGTFPNDAWIMASGYLPLEAVQNKLYMDTLSNEQAIALCILDLAKGYEHKTKNYYDGFILKCCDLVLKYHPKNPMALLLQAETLKQIYLSEQRSQYPKPTATFNEMQSFYVRLYNLGYREMPEKMYMDWLQSIFKERAKYENKNLKKVNTRK